jgi:hypothetical protein
VGAKTAPRRHRDFYDELAELEEAVKDVVYLGGGKDPYLNNLVGLALEIIQSGRTLAATPLDEPTFFTRYILRWVREAYNEVKQIKRDGDN